MPEVNTEENINQFFAFISSLEYPEVILDFFDEIVEEGFPLETFLVKQILDEMGLLPDKYNLYKGYLEVVKKYFTLNCNIIEVGGGYYPRLAKIISKEQSRGSITVYDPNLVINKLSGIKLIKDNFSYDTDIRSCDLLLALAPCEATKIAIEKANKESKEYCVALCGCSHFGTEELREHNSISNSWCQEMWNLAKETAPKDNEVMIDYMAEYYDYPYAIILSKKR